MNDLRLMIGMKCQMEDEREYWSIGIVSVFFLIQRINILVILL